MSCDALPSPRSAIVVLAGGSGSRLGAIQYGSPVNKVLLRLQGRAILLHALHTAAGVPGVERLVLVLRPQDLVATQAAIEADPPALPVDLVFGGASRHASEWAGIRHLESAIEAGHLDVIAVHDAARPLAPVQLFSTVLRTAAERGGAIPGVPAGTLVGRTPQGSENVTADLADPSKPVVRVQTPQAFRAGPLWEAFRAAAADEFEGTDTSSCVERYGTAEVVVVPGSVTNLKVTYLDDVAVAEVLLAQMASA